MTFNLPLPMSSEEREFPDVATALAWLTMQGVTHPRLFLCGSILRDGVPALVKRLEDDLYPSETSATDDFHFVCFTWEEQPFIVISVPMRDDDRMRTLLERVEPGFRLGNGEPHMAEMEPGSGVFALTAWRDGDPTDQQKANIAGFGDAKCFPLTGANVFTIEYLAPFAGGGDRGVRRERGPFVAGVFAGKDGEPPRFHAAAKPSPFRPMTRPRRPGEGGKAR